MHFVIEYYNSFKSFEPASNLSAGDKHVNFVSTFASMHGLQVKHLFHLFSILSPSNRFKASTCNGDINGRELNLQCRRGLLSYHVI